MNVSTVLALAKPDNVATDRIVATKTTRIRDFMLFNILQITVGPKRKPVIRDVISVRAVSVSKELDKMKMFESLDIPIQRFYYQISLVLNARAVWLVPDLVKAPAEPD